MSYRYPPQDRPVPPFNMQSIGHSRNHQIPANYPPSMIPNSTYRPTSSHSYNGNVSHLTGTSSSASSLYQNGVNHSSAEAQYEENSSPGSASANSRSIKGTKSEQNTTMKASTASSSKRKIGSTHNRGDSLDARENDGEEDGQGVQKRKKKAVSCESCRRRKLKCDRGWPCGACRDRNESHLCKWEGGTRPQTQGRDQDNAPILVRMDRIEEVLGAIASHVGLNSTSTNASRDSNQSPSASTSASLLPEKRKRKSLSGPSISSNQCSATSATCVRNKSMLVTSWLPTTNEEARSELLHVLHSLPASSMMLRMCKYYFDEVNYMHYAINIEDFWENQIGKHEELRRKFEDEGERCLQKISNDEIRVHLQFLALILSVSGLCLLFSNQEEFADVAAHVGITPSYGPFFDNAQRALNASNYFEEPTIMSLRVLVLQLWAISAVRGPALSMVLLSQALHQMFALELDHEPPKEMPAVERADRLCLYHTLVVIDWFSAGSIKRSYSIREEPVKHPYLFTGKSLRERLQGSDPLITQHQWLKLELARLNRRGADRSAMSEAEAYSVTIELQREIDDLFMILPEEYRLETDSRIEALDSNFFKRLGIVVALCTQLISLHKRYYIQGWQEVAYQTSRDICFTSARRICSLFKKVFSYDLSIENIMNMDTKDVQASMVSRQKSVSKLWFMSHASVSACLLLQHHYALMDTHPEAAGPNPDQVRKEIVNDLCITKRLFLAISPYSQIARAGVSILTKPEMPMQVQQESGKARNDRNEFESSQDDEATRKRRAKLAMDLQSIIDIDTTTTSSKYRANRKASSHSGTVNHPQMDYQHIYTNPARLGAIDQGSHLRSSTQTLSTPRGVGTGGAGSHLSEMEALLQSTLSTDLYTGLPLAPEASFQRNSDRIGLTPSYLPNGMLGPTTPTTNALMANHSLQACGYDGDHSACNHDHAPHPHPGREGQASSWF